MGDNYQLGRSVHRIPCGLGCPALPMWAAPDTPNHKEFDEPNARVGSRHPLTCPHFSPSRNSPHYVSELESLLGRQSQRLTVYTRQCHLWCFRLDDPLRNRKETQIYVTHSEIELSPTEQHPEHSELNSTIGLALLGGESNIFTIFSPIGSETIQ